jgi:hypothetical protein
MAADTTDMATRTAQLGGAWTAFGSNDHFVDMGGFQERFYEDASLTAGRGYILNGLAATTTQTVSVGVVIAANEKGSNTIAGALFRYVDASNWGLAALRYRRTPGGTYKEYVTLYKCIAGTLTVVKQKTLSQKNVGAASQATVFVSVDAAGGYEVSTAHTPQAISPEVVQFSGTDSVFATSGTLDDGKMGFYGASTSANNTLNIYQFVGYSETTEAVTTDVIRDDGTGELTHSEAFSADADGSDPQPVSSAEGRRIWLSPGLEGQITAKVRTSDSDAEVDTGHTNSTDIALYHRPAFSTFSDALGDPPDEELVMI